MVQVFSDNTKIRCSKFVCFISVMLFLGGAAITAYATKQFVTDDDVSFPSEAQNYTDFKPESIIPTVAILAGVFMIMTAMCGCCTSKFKKIFFTLPFMILALVICVLMFIGATITSGQGGYIEQVQDKACNTELDGGITTGDKIQKEYTKMVDRMMCSAKCPCSPSVYPAWSEVPTERLAESERIDMQRTPITEEQLLDLQTNGFDAAIAPMWFMDTDPETSSVKTISNYKECYEKNLKGIFASEKSSKTPDSSMAETMKYVDAFFDNGGYEFLTALEGKYNCASMCKVPLFWLTKDVSVGPATRECVEAAMESVSSQKWIAIALGITGAFMLLAAFGAFPLCCGYSDEHKKAQEEAGEEEEANRTNSLKYKTNEMV